MSTRRNIQFDALAEKIARIVAPRIVSALSDSKPPVAPDWLNFDQAAAYLGYSTTKAFRDRCSKSEPPPSHKLGRLRRFNRDELDNWVRDQ
jgi:predicted DNA-binding transcriptional regulator AlpA